MHLKPSPAVPVPEAKRMNSTRLALLWSFAERYTSLVISIGSTMLLSRLLTPTQVGIYSLCAAITTVAGILRDFGVSEYLIQEKELNRDKIKAAFGIAIAIAWTIALMIFLLRGPAARFYGEPGVADVMGVLVLHFLILPISSPAFALLNREMAFRKIFALNLVCNAAQALVSVVLAYRGYGYMALAWGPIANVAVQSLLLSWMRPKQSFVLPGLKEARTVLRFGSMFVASRVIEVLARNTHEPIIAKKFDFAAVGLFSRAWGLIDLFNMNVAAAVIRVATPAFAAGHREGRSTAEAFANATTVFTCIAWPFFLLIALTAEEIIRIMFGVQWLAAAPLASILALTAIPTGLYALVPQMMSATGHVKRRLQVTLWVSPLHIVGVFVAAFFSLHAVAAVWFISNTATLVLYLGHLQKVLHVTPKALFKPCLGSAAVTLGSVLAQAAAVLLCRWLAAPALLTLAAAVGCGALGWWLTARWVSHPALTELRGLVKAFTPKGKGNS
jgi:O-antigen/teichoic acid export membrane protein